MELTERELAFLLHTTCREGSWMRRQETQAARLGNNEHAQNWKEKAEFYEKLAQKIGGEYWKRVAGGE